MAGRRDEIRMSDAEIAAFLDEQRTVVCATNGVDGWPHLMPLWFVVRPSGPDGASELWAWTFARSQKVRNLERDTRATLQLEAGSDYGYSGTLEFAEAVVDPATGTVTLRARFPNPQGLLLPGMYVRARLI